MIAMDAARKAVKLAAIPSGLLARRDVDDVVILLFHRIGVGDREIDLKMGTFEQHMEILMESERVLTLEKALFGGEGGVVVTFDDGQADFYDQALPILVRYRVPALLYLATGLVWDGKARVTQAERGMTWSQLEEAVATGLVTVGAHTHDHTDLSRADEMFADEEMRKSRDLIEERLGRPCRHFAYPWAVGSSAADRVARRLFDTAAMDAWRTNRRGRIDFHRLGRVPVLRNDGTAFFRAKARGRLDAERVAYRILQRGPWRRM
jgi:peptidoglycan/xylan/chitin deacetylase (PgdA/CDA1 family)